MAVAWIYLFTILMPVNFLITYRAIQERKKNKKILLALWRYTKR
jgi:hypothetical protein